jgi:hypothetical protein
VLQALEHGGLDANDARVLAPSFSVRVKASDKHRSIVDRIGMYPWSVHERLADRYLLEANNQGRLDIK